MSFAVVSICYSYKLMGKGIGSKWKRRKVLYFLWGKVDPTEWLYRDISEWKHSLSIPLGRWKWAKDPVFNRYVWRTDMRRLASEFH